MANDSSATKARIRTAAAAEFAEHGVAGARVDRIAAAASANKQAIYAYFGDKEKLFGAVLEEAMSELADATPITGDDLPGYVSRLFDYHAAHPQTLRLLLWEALEYGAGPVPGEEDRTRHYGEKAAALDGAHRSGHLPDGLDPGALALLVIGLAGWPMAVPQLRRMLAPGEAGMDRVRDTAVAMVRTLTTLPTD
ncbi:TetR family transcriptional regulator [Kitasatospora sp. McL0602]|uniref:TetR family transcriptional regulator n=1 Tax=Kitasatospora sp. McL0602 TaxID=3439530 RepID=UPI003F886592